MDTDETMHLAPRNLSPLHQDDEHSQLRQPQGAESPSLQTLACHEEESVAKEDSVGRPSRGCVAAGMAATSKALQSKMHKKKTDHTGETQESPGVSAMSSETSNVASVPGGVISEEASGAVKQLRPPHQKLVKRLLRQGCVAHVGKRSYETLLGMHTLTHIYIRDHVRHTHTYTHTHT
jgi:hypothetical protein